MNEPRHLKTGSELVLVRTRPDRSCDWWMLRGFIESMTPEDLLAAPVGDEGDSTEDVRVRLLASVAFLEQASSEELSSRRGQRALGHLCSFAPLRLVGLEIRRAFPRLRATEQGLVRG